MDIYAWSYFWYKIYMFYSMLEVLNLYVVKSIDFFFVISLTIKKVFVQSSDEYYIFDSLIFSIFQLFEKLLKSNLL